jgi:glycerophosphoryl diester phosphodiesterase
VRTVRFGSALVAIIAVAAVSVTPPIKAKVPPNPFRTGRTLNIAHGGGDGLFPENTLYAYEQSVSVGSEVIDVDVRLSKDSQPVAIHDSLVDRTTNGHGRVDAKTVAELRSLDAGYRFAKGNKFPFRGKGITIPTLDSLLQRFPKMLFSLDLKDERVSMNEPVCALLRKYKRIDDIFVGSNNDEQILAFRKSCVGIRTSATMVDVYASQKARETDDPNFIPDVFVDQPPYRIDGRTLVDADSLAFAHRHGIAILTWVVDDPKDMKKLVRLGVDGIYTRRPDLLSKVLRSENRSKTKK